MCRSGRILVVDDDESTCRTLHMIFEKKGYGVLTAGSIHEALKKAVDSDINLAFLDIRLPDGDGVSLISPLRKMLPDIGIVMATAYATLETAMQACNDGASRYITKPLEMNEVLKIVEDIMEQQQKRVKIRRRYDSVVSELSRWKITEKKLVYQATHDSLTGLVNRAHFNELLVNAIQEASIKQFNVAVMLMDLDFFKTQNDTLGHRMGDRILKEVGRRLSEILRKGDTVARIGGDEFTLLLPDFTSLKDVVGCAQRVLEIVREPIGLAQKTVQMTTSIGMALYPEDAPDAGSLLHQADIAMYSAKKDGRDNYKRWTQVMETGESTR